MPSQTPSRGINSKPHICVWSDFTLKQIDELMLIRDVEQVKRKFAEFLKLEDFLMNKKSAILVDLFYFTFAFARECSFDEQQTSALLSIIKRTHEKAIETPFGNVDSTFEYFRELMLRHSIRRPPFSIELYSVGEVKRVTDYVVDTYFKHFKLYKYAFTPKIRLNMTIDYLGLPETPEPESAEDTTVNDEETQEKKDEDTEEINVEVPPVEDPPAVQELKTLINSTLTEKVQKLKMNVDQQLKSNEETIMKKIAEAAGTERAGSRKSRKK